MSEEKDYRDRKGYHPEDEEPVRTKGHKKKPSKRYKGCPEREGSAHLYVWIEMHGKRQAWKLGDGDGWQEVETVWWEERCVGCAKRRRRVTSWWGNRPAPSDIYEVRTDQLFTWY